MANIIGIHIATPDICTGCAACANVCPKGCISMVEDREGFLQPKIDTEICIGCHKCEKICPILNNETISDELETKAYAVINSDEEARMQSSSGGMFHALAKWVIEQGGVVFGARWDENWIVKHDYAEDMDGIRAFMQSKYVQSRVGDTYKQAKEFLKQDRWVLYTGTPCQLGGLRAYLGKEYEKLIQVDLICHGVPSPGVWRKYLKDRVGKDTILGINMRDKSRGWSKFRFFTTTTTTTTTTTCEPQKQNPFFRGFLKNTYLRRSCHYCQFRAVHRNTDFTLADYWGVWEMDPDMHDDKGTSAVFVHSVKGKRILQDMRDLVLKSVPVQPVVDWNLSMVEDEVMNEKRELFFSLYHQFGFRFAEYWADVDRIYVRVIRKINKFITKWHKK